MLFADVAHTEVVQICTGLQHLYREVRKFYTKDHLTSRFSLNDQNTVHELCDSIERHIQMLTHYERDFVNCAVIIQSIFPIQPKMPYLKAATETATTDDHYHFLLRHLPSQPYYQNCLTPVLQKAVKEWRMQVLLRTVTGIAVSTQN